VLLSKWVPQQKLLSNDKLKLFLTHCGGNSAVEGLYFGTPLLGFPQNADQFGMCARVNHLGVGTNGDPWGSPEAIRDQIVSLSSSESGQLHRARQVMQLMEFE